ncbi:hypothetical protein SDRG_11299 [Saprolegnia diclina VS20]|uniref:Uncharacterized protein n=1 Tax=Saprolegnia diclina (strain VS20) TaxID=1156394 RepID=T0PZV7_SAPDV|nr:hypothetical protein SDRG_11299 [Saprolegnia diclina VS20]EQC31114.1 hypothetical protein SDRG_11299 [Saprolegnia diclina VS20]|eukprot:XP_008615553.1 hypothetical protein SDRG_11299 [Saprolegnia diclina VS20]
MHKWLGIVHSDSEAESSDSDSDLFDAADNSAQRARAKAYADDIASRRWGLSHRDRAGLAEGQLALTPTIAVAFAEELGQQRRVWDCALVLSKFLTNSAYFAPDYFAGKRVIELGCGIGVPGISAALLGASDVVLTDMAVALPWINVNIAKNRVEHIARAETLLWGPSPSASLGAFDVILCSDLIYGDEELSQLLVATIRALSHATTVVVSAYEARAAGNQGAHFLAAIAASHDVERVPHDALDAVYQSANLHVQLLRPRA